MLRFLVSGMNSAPTTTVMALNTIGWHSPHKVSGRRDDDEGSCPMNQPLPVWWVKNIAAVQTPRQHLTGAVAGPGVNGNT